MAFTFCPEDFQDFTPEQLKLRTRQIVNVPDILNKLPGKVSLGCVDAGGNKIALGIATVSDNLQISYEFFGVFIEDRGVNYISHLLDFKTFLQEKGISAIGISFGGPINGTVFEGTDYLSKFFADFHKYNDDFQQLFPGFKVAVVNDAVALNIGMATHLKLKSKSIEFKNIISLIFGGGMGGGALIGLNQIIEAEPGHIPARRFNSYGVTDECQMWCDGRICQQDACAGSVSFIEKLASKHFKRKVTGVEAAQMYLAKDKFIIELYQVAANCYARTYLGMLKLLNLNTQETIFVLHGGGAKTPDFAENVAASMNAYLGGANISILKSHDYSQNMCLDGAVYYAVASLLATKNNDFNIKL